MEIMGIFKNAWNKAKGVITGGSDKETENPSRRSVIKQTKLTSNEINFLHNKNKMQAKKLALRRMRNKMRRKTQQQQRF